MPEQPDCKNFETCPASALCRYQETCVGADIAADIAELEEEHV